MPWQAPFKILTGEEREPRGELSEGGSGGVVKKVFLQSMGKFVEKYLKRKTQKKLVQEKFQRKNRKLLAQSLAGVPSK